jgi:hypothetical protein
MNVKVGQFYKLKKKPDEYGWRDLDLGELFEVIAVDNEKVRVAALNINDTLTFEEFEARFSFDPDGFQHRQQEMSGLIQEISSFQFSQKQLTTELTQLESTSTAIVTSNAMTQQKHEISLVKAKVDQVALAMTNKQKRLMSLLEEQKHALERRLEPMKQMVERLNEGVYTINLFLGVGESLTQIAKGEPASAEDKVFIRQQVLYMDEECRYDPDKGGLDFATLDKFDEWLLKSKSHVDQILPEKKGVIALQVRRNEKDYGSPWANQRNAENIKSYFLIRNGENLWRIHADIRVGDHLFPKRGEFDDFFFERDYRGRIDGPALRAGTMEFNKAMKDADAHRRHFMRILLILQGLFDRTEIFAPITSRPNLLDRREQSEVFEFISDAEMLLPDGRKRFFEWLQEVNSTLMVGHRVCGVFDTYGAYQTHCPKERSLSKYAWPKNGDIFVIDRAERDGFVFLFDREDWRGSPTRRASFLVYRSDKFIINIDGASIEDMEFYLNSRLDRPEYLHLVPLLRTAIKTKRQEKATEAPFRALLVGHVSKGNPTAQVEKVVDELIEWYKFKNKNHRALSKDDRKAYTMIVEEYRLRQERAAERQRIADSYKDIVAAIQKQAPDVMFIGHKSGNEFGSFAPENTENVFVRETTWKASRGVVTEVKTNRWTLLDKRFHRWDPLFSAPRFAGWPTELRMADYLTDEERSLAIEEARKYASSGWGKRDIDNGRKPRCVLLSASCDPVDHKVTVCINFASPKLTKKPLTGSTEEPGVNNIEVRWERTGANLKLNCCSSSGEWRFRFHGGEKDKKNRPWLNKQQFWKDDKALAQIEAEIDQIEEISERATVLRERSCKFMPQLRSVLQEWMEKKAFANFVKDNHPSLWPKFKSDNPIQAPYECCGAADVFDHVVEAGIDPEGMTWGTVLAKAQQLGCKIVENSPLLEFDKNIVLYPEDEE